MKVPKIISYSLGVVLIFYRIAFADFFDVYIDKVLEADVFILRGGTLVKCAGLDAPHLRDGNPLFKDLAKTALAFSKSTLEKQKVRLEFVENVDDRSMRSAYIFVRGRSFNALLLQKGYAIINSEASLSNKYYNYLYGKQKEAILTKRGIWKKIGENDANKISHKSYAFK